MIVESSVESGLQHGPFDFVVVTMKSLPDIYSIPSIIAPAITSRVTAIVLIQNGYGIEQPLVDAFPQNTVLSGVSMVGSEQKGTHIVQTDPAVLFLGPFYNGDLVRDEQDAAARRFADIYNLGGARCTVTEDIEYHRWQKLVWNASFGPVCALSGLDSADIHDAGCRDTLLIPVMNELVSLAAAAGYVLPETIIHDTLHDIPKESRFKPSMLVDALSQRPMEIESTLGNPLQVAKSLGVQLPKLTMLYHLLKARGWSFKHDSR
jgi:2-dehydropantoate 2-reductase